MELWLAVQAGEGDTRDVAVRAPVSSTLADTADAVATALRLPRPPDGARWALYSHRLEAWLAGDELLAAAGLRHGDTVALAASATPGPRSGPHLVEVMVTAGAAVGSRVQLGAGDHVVGRGADAAIHLDDPFIAPEHARLSVAADRMLVTDLGGGAGTLIDGEVVAGSRALRPGQVITAGASTLVVRALREPSSDLDGANAEVPFNRPPRVIQAPGGGVHWLAAPPAEARRPRLPLVTALLPLLLGGVMLVFSRNPIALVFLAMSPVLAIGSYIESRMGGRGDYRRATDEFRGRVSTLTTELAAATAEEVRRRAGEAPDLRRLALAAHRREPWLWERRPQDDDFLQLRVALADLPSRHLVETADGGDSVLRGEASVRLEPLTSLVGVPLVVPFAERGAVGLAGPRGAVLDSARWLVTQAAVLHSPRNLSICAALPREEAAEWDWLKWLPHSGGSARQFDGPSICVDNASARDLVERLLALLDARGAEVGPFRGTTTRAPYSYVLAILHEDLPLSRTTLTRLLAEGPRVGIVVLWIGRAARDLPNECRAVIDVDAAGALALTYPGEGTRQPGDATADRAGAEESRQVALELAPLRDTAAGDARGQLPRRVGLLEVLGLGSAPSAQEIAGRWSAGGADLSAPLGVSAEGTFALDLRGDGPHGLIGGTTGAGKSELLQSLVGSLAASHSPRRLNFLLVDYKGGSAFKDAVQLPHTVGLVTDLDGHLANRALVSLRAELRRREQVLREASVRDLAELERRGDADCPASLVIVVDEFATLVKEVPEFVDGVVDLAQRGRSLGLHLLLATQRPAGVINDSIRANTNIRIALRMSDDAESADVIGVPDASRIPRTWPGRGFARTGHQELTEFQAAYAGGAPGGGQAGAGVEVVALGATGPAWPPAPQVDVVADEGSELHALVRAIGAAHAGLGGTPAGRPWLPELPRVVSQADLAPAAGDSSGLLLGLVDLPESQRQQPWRVDLNADGNLLVLGTAASGKTSLLRTVAHALALTDEPSALHLYALDCAGGGLSAVQALPHCGAYVRADETERVGRLVQWLRALIDERRAHTSAAMSAARGSGQEATIVVLLDSYGGFVSAMEKVDFGEHVDALPRLMADGPAVGVHFVLTADRRGAIPGTVSALVSSRLVLRMADDDEYRNAGLAAEAFRGVRLAPGRGFVGTGSEVQCAVLGDEGSAEEQVRVLQDTGAALTARFGAVDVPAIRLLPTAVAATDLPVTQDPLAPVIGLLDSGLAGAVLDLTHDGQVIVGPPRSGRSTALGIAAQSIRQCDGTAHLVLLAPRRSPLTDLAVWDEVARGAQDCERLAEDLAERCRNEAADASATTIVFVDDGDEVADGAVSAALEVVAKRGRDSGVRLVAAVETGAAHRAYGGWIAELRKARQGLLLQPDVDIDGDLLGARLPRRASRAFPPGRGYLVRRGTVDLVQVAAPAAT
ncbi:MAG TPA: FtsK/SpoIIIE domain-containing protein [Candidatus Dormibacteraeota bacterium]|jgi:S-DNA-T family DNA segregation ATPase FtsK/SpoIIIE